MLDANSGRSFDVKCNGRWWPVIAWNDQGIPLIADLTLRCLVQAVNVEDMRYAEPNTVFGPPPGWHE